MGYLAVLFFGSVLIPAAQASTVLVASSGGESLFAGAVLVRRINDESEFVRAVEVEPQAGWTVLGPGAPWVSRSTDYTSIPEDVVLEFTQNIYIPPDFEVEFGLLVMLSAFASYSTLNGFELTLPIFHPGDSCADPSPGSPGCVVPFGVDVTPFLAPGANLFLSQGLGIGGSGIAQSWEFNIFGSFKPVEAVPEPRYAPFVGSAMFSIALYRCHRRGRAASETKYNEPCG
jgi:hypothetical protein